MYMDVTEEFKREQPLFIGSKIIYTTSKVVSTENIGKYFDIFLQLRKNFPQFVVGFDLVGQEVICIHVHGQRCTENNDVQSYHISMMLNHSHPF